jgi:phosphatidylcholine synthase
MRFAVHLLTAAGAGCAMMALMAAAASKWATMFGWLGAALALDAVDGPLARRFQVHERLPRWSGETLDLVVDFTTYVFVPAYAIAASGVLPAALEAVAAVAIVVSAALYFADRNMKTPDNYFRGFPGLWNVAAFYLLLVRPRPEVAAAWVAALVVLTFVPFPFIHPVRVTRFRAFNLVLIGAWTILAVVAVTADLMPPPWVTVALSVIALYVCCAGLFRSAPPN